MSDAFKTMFEQTTQPSLLAIAQTFLPWLDLIPTKRAATEKRCMDVMTTVGTVRSRSFAHVRGEDLELSAFRICFSLRRVSSRRRSSCCRRSTERRRA